MTTMRLDESQLEVVELPVTDRVLVIAGPGQGKTEVVAKRLEHLVGTEGLSPADELLVLSFSRAAVSAVRRRVRGRGRSAAVAVRTFDSFASRVLVETGVEPQSGFDQRVRQAAQLLAREPEQVDSIEMLRHVIIDEVQDLVGDRAEMVLALLRSLDPDVGFTALGDPMQSLYDFQLREAHSRMGNPIFLQHLESDCGAKEMSLEHDYRATTSQTREITATARKVRAATSIQRRLDLLQSLINDLPSVGAVEDLAEMLPAWTGTTALLCQTNGQAMVLSKALSDHGVPNEMKRPSQEMVVPPWVALALGDAPSPQLRREEVIARLAEHLPDDVAPEEAWRLLKESEKNLRSPGSLNLLALSRRLQTGNFPVELTRATNSNVIVSTVHRAKGLEFDNVVFTNSAEESDEESADALTKELIVAVTRGRRRVHVMEAPSMRHIYLDKRCRPARWLRGGRARWMTTGFEVKPGDVETKVPNEADNSTAEQVQRNLLVMARSTDLEVEALMDANLSTPEAPVYRLEREGLVLGVTSEAFGLALDSRLRRAWRAFPAWPERLEALHLHDVVTVGGEPDLQEKAQRVGRWGLWLAPRVSGLSRLHFPAHNRENP